MQKYLLSICCIFTLSLGSGCVSRRKQKDVVQVQVKAPEQVIITVPPNTDPKSDVWEPIIAIYTTEGEIRVKLYNETPVHRDNFLKLVEERFYDSLLFHRVIKNFVIQGGDPDSKKAKNGLLLGDGDVGYWVPPEFDPKLFHKRGALASARESDLMNPNQESSGCQFYIVQGRTYSDSLLKVQGKRVVKNKLYNQVIKRTENKKLVENYVRLQKEKPDSALYYMKEIDKIVEKELPDAPPHQFTPEQVKAYTTVGGTPHLDGSYTVFGEVIQGMDIVDRIAGVERDGNDRPYTNIRITSMLILKKI